MKKRISIFFILCLMLSFVGVHVSATETMEGTTNEGFTYVINDGEAKITWYDNEPVAVLQIPSCIDGYPVTKIEASSFNFSAGCQEFSVEGDNEYFTVIDGVLFSKDAKKLVLYPSMKGDATYTVPDSVIEIADSAFCMNYEIEDVIFNDKLERIGVAAFAWDEAINNIYFPESLKYIGDQAFGYCWALENVYYAGTEAQWKEIIIGEHNNDELNNATIHFAEDTESTVPETTESEVTIPVGETLGDVNTDGAINVKDATTIQKYVASLVELTEEAFAVADFNSDSTVNVKDATTIQKFIAGIV